MSPAPRLRFGRYTLFEPIASGGMATVYYGRLQGDEGFSRTVAVKQLHPHLSQEAGFAEMFLDEARLAARIQHPNVVQTLDVVSVEQGVFIVMEYLQGETLTGLLRDAGRAGVDVPVDIALAIVCGLLVGLHAAHEARTETGEPLCIVHRDVSPQNLLVGTDGLARVLDFGIAKAAQRAQQQTRTGELKGKVAYMAPEQLSAGAVDRRTDIYAAGVVLWEALTRHRLFSADNDLILANLVLQGASTLPSHYNPRVPTALDAIVFRALSFDPDHRYATALEMVEAIEAAHPVASPRAVGALVQRLSEKNLTKRARYVAEIERSSKQVVAIPSAPVAPSSAPATHGDDLTTRSFSGFSRAADSSRPWALFGVIGALSLALVGLSAFHIGASSSASSPATPGSSAAAPSAPAAAPSVSSALAPAASSPGLAASSPAPASAPPPASAPAAARPSPSPAPKAAKFTKIGSEFDDRR